MRLGPKIKSKIQDPESRIQDPESKIENPKKNPKSKESKTKNQNSKKNIPISPTQESQTSKFKCSSFVGPFGSRISEKIRREVSNVPQNPIVTPCLGLAGYRLGWVPTLGQALLKKKTLLLLVLSRVYATSSQIMLVLCPIFFFSIEIFLCLAL